MPPTIKPPHLRQLEVMLGAPARAGYELKHQQHGGTSGTIPGTDSDPTVVGMQVGSIWIWPETGESPNGDQIAGVGHAAVVPYIATDGTVHYKPISATGNLQVTQAGNVYNDRSAVELDNEGNIVAWHSGTDGPQHTILTNPQSGTYTFSIHDVSKCIESESATAVTFTVPTFASAGIPIGGWIEVFQYGAGKLTIAAASGVTLRSPGGLVSTAMQYATIGVRQRAQDEWVLTGALG